MRSAAALSLLALALLLVAAPGLAIAGPTTTPGADGNGIAQGGTTIAVQLESDGDARWNVTARFPLRSASEREAFARLATEFENGQYDGRFDIEIFETTADLAAAETDRPMEIRNGARSTSVGNASGRLSLTFTWTNFSKTAGTRLLVGDVFRTESTSWLPRLADDQTLIVHPPAGYEVQSTKWPVVNRTIWIEGPQSFQPGEPSITYVGQGGTVTPNPNGIFGETSLSLAIVVILSAIIGGGYMWVRRRDDTPAMAERTESTVASERDQRHIEELVQPADADSVSHSDEDGDDADSSETVDVTLLSDEERVERLLEERGGRMKQATIVKETGWSNAKVSQLLSAMDEDDQINKLRIGRENLISLPDEDMGEFD